MYRKIINFLKRNALIIGLSLASVITILPLLKYGGQAAFYNVDPDVVYVGNAISYIKSHIIFFTGHPGTPVMIFLGWMYLPLRIFAKFIAQQPFVEWSFDNLRFLFMYSRLSIFLVFSFSVFIFLKSVNILTKSLSSVFFAWCGLFLFIPIFTLGAKISAENGIFFIVPLWLYLFSIFLKRQKGFYILLMALVAGIGEAIKINSLVLVFATGLIALFWGNKNIWQRIKYVLLVLIICTASFFLATWPSRAYFMPELTRFMRVVVRSGIDGAHGIGDSPFVNLQEYFPNLQRIMRSSKYFPYFIIGSIGMAGFLLIRKRMKPTDPIFLLLAATVLNFLILLKYTLTYYQLPNYLVFVFLSSYFVGKLGNKTKLLLLALLVIPVVTVTTKSLHNEERAASSAALVESTISKDPAKIATLWDFGPTKDFAYIWIRSWAEGVFRDELAVKRPDLLELDAKYEKVYKNSYAKPINIWDICWDKLYIREERAGEFLARHSDKTFITKPIGESGIWVIDSRHCTPGM